jgi:hypothetical protein
MSCLRKGITDGTAVWTRPKSAPMFRREPSRSPTRPAFESKPVQVLWNSAAPKAKTNDIQSEVLPNPTPSRSAIDKFDDSSSFFPAGPTPSEMASQQRASSALPTDPSDDSPSTELDEKVLQSLSKASSGVKRSAIYRRLMGKLAPRTFGSIVTQGSQAHSSSRVVPDSVNDIESRLVEALAHIPTGDTFSRLNHHRIAFEEYIRIVNPSAKSLLSKIYDTYQEVVFSQHQQSFDALRTRMKESESTLAEQREKERMYRYQIEGLKLEVADLKREVHSRNELLSQISATHKINLSMVNWITGVESKMGQRTMAEIRTVQKRVTAAYGEAQRIAARDGGESGAGGADKQPADSQEARTEMRQLEAQLSDLSKLNGITAVELRERTQKKATPTTTQSDDSTQFVNHDAGPSSTSRDLSPTDLSGLSYAELYRVSQRVENIGVDLSTDTKDPIVAQPQPLKIRHTLGVHAAE